MGGIGSGCAPVKPGRLIDQAHPRTVLVSNHNTCTWRQPMSINHLYHTSLQHLRQLRPSERITRVRTFAALMAGIMQSKSVHLSHIALSIPGRAKALSTTRRLERLLDNGA